MSLKMRWLLVGLFAVGSWLRLYRLGDIPGMMHRDEAAMGYNAYSLAETGKDEHGKPWPLVFESFGDYKLPGLIYASYPLVKQWGLSPFTTRFPTALLSVLSLPLLYVLVQQLGLGRKTALLAMALLTFDYWHVSQARNAYEPMASLPFELLTLYAWLKLKESKWWILGVWGGFLGAVCLYSVPVLLLPLLLTLWWVGEKRLERGYVFTLAGCLVIMVMQVRLLGPMNASRNQGLIWGDPLLVTTIQQKVQAATEQGIPLIASRILFNKVTVGSGWIVRGYLAAFNPLFLWFEGDRNVWHNLRSIGVGNMHPVMGMGVVAALWLLLRKRSSFPGIRLLGLWILVSPIPDALTIDAPITNRLVLFFVGLTVMAAWGLSGLKLPGKLVIALCGMIWLSFGVQYYWLYNRLMEPGWNSGLNQVVVWMKNQDLTGKQVVMAAEVDQAYIFWLFYGQYEPATFQQQAVWYKDGFSQVRSFGPYEFGAFPDKDKWVGEKADLVIYRGNAATHGWGQPVYEIKDSLGKLLWSVVEIKREW